MIAQDNGDLLAKRMGLLQKEFTHHRRKTVLPRSRVQVKPFDVETTFAEVTLQKKYPAKKYHGPDSPLYSAIYPLVCIMKVFGLAPYDFSGDEMVPSNICIVFSIAFTAIYCHIMYLVYLRFASFKRHKAVLGVVETSKVIVNYLVTMHDLVLTILKRKAFCRIWNDLQDFDEKLSQLGYPRKESNTQIATWILLMCQLVAWTIINQSGIFAFMETWLFNVSYMCVYVGSAISVFKFFGMVCFLGQRFHQLNQIAKENLPPRQGYKSSYVSRKAIEDLHQELMLSSEALDSLYSTSLLFWLGNLSMHSVTNLYFISDWVLLTTWSDLAWPLIFNMWSWLMEFVAQLLALHIACHYTMNEANSMGAILIEWDARIIQRFPYDDTARTSLHYLNRRLRFSAGGLYNVDLSLFCSIVGMMSTYLVLLLQFPS